MAEPYAVHKVQPGWIFKKEMMGTKKKFWYKQPAAEGQLAAEERDWLFKFAQPNTGQHWAEKIAAEVARVLGVRHAQVELAIFEGKHGSTTESFAHDGWELWHGNQILAGYFREYDPEVTFHQSNHTLSNIWKALDGVFKNPDAARRAKITIAEYIVLDALTGNTDRHHENWGILRKRVGTRWRGVVAPSFDHASSLGRELLDARRERLLDEDRIGRYAERGRGGIYWSNDERRGPSPLELVRRASRTDPELLQPALARLQTLSEHSIRDMIDRVPAACMGSPARRFALALMRYNLHALRELI